jgi:hypothetical protein
MFILLNNVTTDAENINHFHFVTLIYTQISVLIQKDLRLQFQRQL